MPVIAEDMGRPLDYGLLEYSEEIDDCRHNGSTALTSVGFVQDSSQLTAATADSQAEGGVSYSATTNHAVC